MNRYVITISLAFQLMSSCTSPIQPATENRKFHLPIIVLPNSSTYPPSYKKVDSLSEINFQFAGKFKFADTVKPNLDKNGFLDPHRGILRTDILFGHNRIEPNDSLSSDGFQVFPDYKTSVYLEENSQQANFCYFPVYAVNETSSTKIFFARDSHVFSLQEAIDSTYGWPQWRPIESVGRVFCGSGHFGLKIHPGEFVMFLVPKYQGELKREMRIRLQVGESIYISRSYEGTLSAKQFNIAKTSWLYNYIMDPKHPFPTEHFYGAVPKGFDPYESKK